MAEIVLYVFNAERDYPEKDSWIGKVDPAEFGKLVAGVWIIKGDDLRDKLMKNPYIDKIWLIMHNIDNAKGEIERMKYFAAERRISKERIDASNLLLSELQKDLQYVQEQSNAWDSTDEHTYRVHQNNFVDWVHKYAETYTVEYADYDD